MEFDAQVLATVAAILQGASVDEYVIRRVLGIPAQHLICSALYQHTLAAMAGPCPPVWSYVHEALAGEDNTASSTPFVGAVVASACGLGAGAAFATALCDTAPVDFVQGVRVRLGLPVCSLLPKRCSCGFLLLDVHGLVVNSHLLSCPHNKGITKTTRHNLIVRALQTVCQEFHLWRVSQRFCMPHFVPIC
jgi:hypothetical protein